MSIRRKSCDSCFAARRKCDLKFPICERCERNTKTCHYRYPPQLPMGYGATPVGHTTATGSGAALVTSGWTSYAGQLRNNMQFQQLDPNLTFQWVNLGRSSIPKPLGHLGELAPITGCTPTWKWVFEQIRDFPLAFARQAETVFIHKSMYGGSLPKPLRAAFGICAACVSINDRNRSIIRIFYGGIVQRIVAERQEFLIRSYGLTLLLRADSELQSAPQTWETWLLAESIRRTVLISFKLYTVYSNYTYGICAESAAIGILPVSTRPSSWNSRGAYLRCLDQEETTTYGEFASNWLAAPRKEVELYEKFLLVGCKQIENDQVEALMGLGSDVE
ncbi:hypothetical protein V8E51_016164 [Hyaloscypha variabilis]